MQLHKQTWQAVTMLHLGAQERSDEHRIKIQAHSQKLRTCTTIVDGNRSSNTALNPSTTWVSPSGWLTAMLSLDTSTTGIN